MLASNPNVSYSGVNLKREGVPVDHSIPKPGTLENVLMWARNTNSDELMFYSNLLLM